MRPIAARLTICLALLLAAGSCAAQSAYEQGRSLYKAGDYPGAAAQFEQAAKQTPNDARVWWQLNFAYHRLNRNAEALQAVQKAGELDPSHAFASGAGKYEQILAQRQQEAGTAASGAAAPGPAAPAAPAQGAPLPGVAAPQDLPPGGEPTNFAAIIVAIIAVVVVVWLLSRLFRARPRGGTPPRVSAESLEDQKNEVLAGVNYLQDNAGALEPARQTAVRSLRTSAGTRLEEAIRLLNHSRGPADLNHAQHLLDQAQADVARGRALIAAGPGAADTAADPPPSAPEVGSQSASASAPASAVPPVAGFSSGASPAGGHRVTIEGAQPAQAHPGFSGRTPPVAGAASGMGTDWQQVPRDQRGVCFFCSRPMLLSELTPVTVNLEGRQQRVLACPDDLATVRTGQLPQIRAFSVNGRYVPWYAYEQYDPFVDYYGRGYYTGGGSFLADMVALSIIDDMFWSWQQPVGWGWGGYGGWGGPSPYAFFPEHDDYRDYYGGMAGGYGDYSDVGGAAAGAAAAGAAAGAGGDFLGSTGANLGGAAGGAAGGDIGADRS